MQFGAGRNLGSGAAGFQKQSTMAAVRICLSANTRCRWSETKPTRSSAKLRVCNLRCITNAGVPNFTPTRSASPRFGSQAPVASCMSKLARGADIFSGDRHVCVVSCGDLRRRARRCRHGARRHIRHIRCIPRSVQAYPHQNFVVMVMTFAGKQTSRIEKLLLDPSPPRRNAWGQGLIRTRMALFVLVDGGFDPIRTARDLSLHGAGNHCRRPVRPLHAGPGCRLPKGKYVPGFSRRAGSLSGIR